MTETSVAVKRELFAALDKAYQAHMADPAVFLKQRTVQDFARLVLAMGLVEVERQDR